jgi:adiponectin receptor
MSADSLPEWYRPYEFVPTHYRPPSSVGDAALSVFQWHNETLNIYTHLIPGLYYLWLYTVTSFGDVPWEVRLFQTVSSLGPVAMGLGSAFAHTFYIVDSGWNTFVWRVDFAGIVCVNLSHQLLDTILLYKMAGASTGLGFVLLAEVAFALRCIWEIFSGVGHHWGIQYPLLSGIPLTALNLLLSMGANAEIRHACLYSFLCTVFILIAGGIFFVGKVPERFCPGRFYYLHSHTLHHIFIIASIMAGRMATVL